MGRGDWGTSRRKSLDPTFDGNVPTTLLGDWGVHRQGTELACAPEWSSSWSPDTWKAHVDFLVDRLKADTLALCMSGFELPYASQRFPEAVELDHANVATDFFQEVIDHACARGLSLIALFCTTGHAAGYAAAHPECTTVGADGRRHPTNLCHHHPLGRGYAEGVATEMLGRYRGFSGVSFHPPENAVPCHCSYCRAAYHRATGRPMAAASEQEISDFYWTSCLGFQREMEQLARRRVPGVRVFSVTIPGRFEDDFAILAPTIPKATMLLHWDYWSVGERIPELLRSLALFRSSGHSVGFVASSGWSLDKLGPTYGDQIVAQVDAVRTWGVEDILYFVGAIWHEPSLLATSWALRRPPPLG